MNPAVELEDVVNSSDRKLTVTVPTDQSVLKINKKHKSQSKKKQLADALKTK